MTPRSLTRLLACSPAIFLTACTDPPPATADAASSDAFEAITRVYHCADRSGPVLLVTRTRPEGMSIFLPPSLGEQHRLLAEVEAGRHYAAGGAEVMVSEGGADLILPGRRYAGCQFDPRASVWEHAKLGGADFRGLGNEPGWAVEVREQSRLWFSYDYGAQTATMPILETIQDPASRSTTYVGRSGSMQLTVTLTGEPCADTMADETYPTRVTVTLDGRTFRGCGRPLH